MIRILLIVVIAICIGARIDPQWLHESDRRAAICPRSCCAPCVLSPDLPSGDV